MADRFKRSIPYSQALSDPNCGIEAREAFRYRKASSRV